jgi:hypothetical protein
VAPTELYALNQQPSTACRLRISFPTPPPLTTIPSVRSPFHRLPQIDHGRQPARDPSCHSESSRGISNYSASRTSSLLPSLRVAEDPPPSTASPAPPKLLERVRWHLRVKHYSIRTEQAYVDWIRRFILFHKKRHPDQIGHVKASLTCRSQLRFGDVLGLCFAFACGRRALHQLHSQLTKAHIAT